MFHAAPYETIPLGRFPTDWTSKQKVFISEAQKKPCGTIGVFQPLWLTLEHIFVSSLYMNLIAERNN